MRCAFSKFVGSLLLATLASCSALAKPRENAPSAGTPLSATMERAAAESQTGMSKDTSAPLSAAVVTPTNDAPSSSSASAAAPANNVAKALPAVLSTATAGPPAAPAGAGVTASDRPAAEPVDPEALLAALTELEGVGLLDGETRQRLIADLRHTDPALWPAFLQYFKSSMLRRAAERAAAEESARIARGSAPAAADDTEAAPVAIASDQPAAESEPEEKVTAPRKTKGATVKPAAAAAPVTTVADGADQTPTATLGSSAATSGSVAKGGAASSTSPAKSVDAGRLAKATPANGSDVPAWQDQLQATIAGLEASTHDAPQSQAEVGRHATLRMLYLLAGRREDALQPINGISPVQQDFWSQEIYGLATYLDTERNPESARRATEALDRLRTATTKLGEQATLAVKNLTFCTEVTSFGVYKPFEKLEFQAGQEVLLYAEVENFRSQRDEKGYHTALRSSYQILDPHGARVEAKEFDVTEERCQNQRRDFFMRYHIWMPKRIYGGRYTLQLTIEDTQSQKIGQSSIEFTIKDQ